MRECDVEAGLSAVAIHAGEENFSRAKFYAALGPGEGVEVRGIAATADADVPTIILCLRLDDLR